MVEEKEGRKLNLIGNFLLDCLIHDLTVRKKNFSSRAKSNLKKKINQLSQFLLDHFYNEKNISKNVILKTV